MSRVLRYATATAQPGRGDELAELMLKAAEGTRKAPGCELYLVSRKEGAPDEVHVTELWEDEAAMLGALELARADEQGSQVMQQVMGLVADFSHEDLQPVGGVGPGERPAPGWHKLTLDEVDDIAPGAGLGEVMQMRSLTSPLGLERTGATLQHVLPGRRQPFGHTHVNAEETYVVLNGSGTLRLPDDEVPLAPRDAVRVAPGLTRAFEAGPDGLEYLVFGARAKGDGFLSQGWWGGPAAG